jgi:transposase
MLDRRLTSFLLHRELKVFRVFNTGARSIQFEAEKISDGEVCTRCATFSDVIYDRRWVRIKDEPIRGKLIYLRIRKRRFYCKTCRKPFTEPIPGVLPRRRTTQRFRRSVMWACQTFCDLKQVRNQYNCSNDFVYRAHYEQLELKRRQHNNYPWPKSIGIDEHSFRRNKYYGRMDFVTMVVDHKNRKLFELVNGKTKAEMIEQLANIPGRENVKVATIDMCDPYKNFVTTFFPQAKIVADKFHVLRLITPSLLKRRKEITGTRADLRAKKYLLMSIKKLDYTKRRALREFLAKHPDLYELYTWKEKLHRFYRTPGYHNASKALKKLISDMAWSIMPEVQKLRKTLKKWQEEILNFWLYRITNARTEGFNNVAKLVKRRAYGFKNYESYRLKLLSACC